MSIHTTHDRTLTCVYTDSGTDTCNTCHQCPPLQRYIFVVPADAATHCDIHYTCNMPQCTHGTCSDTSMHTTPAMSPSQHKPTAHPGGVTTKVWFHCHLIQPRNGETECPERKSFIQQAGRLEDGRAIVPETHLVSLLQWTVYIR